MNILYMGYFCNENAFNKLVAKGSQSSHARQQLETNLIKGLISLAEGEKLELISYLPLISVVREEVGAGEIYQGVNIKYLWCNKRNPFSVAKAILTNMRYIRGWAKGKKSKVVLTYSNNPIHTIPTFLLRRLCNIKIVTLCSEVSVFRRGEGVPLATRISRKVSSSIDNSFDGYIVLTKYMNEIVNQKGKPSLVMEGISADTGETIGKSQDKKKAILYAGGLTKENGLEILLEGFQSCKHNEVELWICGDGPLKSIIQDYAKRDKNIKYFGIVENNQVKQMEQQAAILINPRFSKNEFTKYSFPSKTLEYMSSGTPTILTRLGGIPEEYFNYAYVLEDESVAGVTSLLDKVLSIDEVTREQLGERAREYVLKSKNSMVQAKEVYRFLERF